MIPLTAHTRKNRRNRTEIDIATQYFEEEKEKTKQLLRRKSQKITPNATDGAKLSKTPSKPRHNEKKTDIQKIPKTKKIFNRKPHIKKELSSSPKPKNLKKRAVMKKNRNSNTRVKKRARAQYFHRFKI